jgi:nitroreductase
MEFRDVVATRRSIRRYKTDPVPDDVVNQIFEAARIAPSAGHRQPWHFSSFKTPQPRNSSASPPGPRRPP